MTRADGAFLPDECADGRRQVFNFLDGVRNALRLDKVARTCTLTKPKMKLDLGGIAKGYAADQALAVLKSQGVVSALVDASGDLAIGAAPPGQQGWKIGIAPLEAGSPPSRFLMLAECGVATSGDAWQFVEIDGHRYSHIIDPHTGIGLTTRSSVTVIAPDLVSFWDAWNFPPRAVPGWTCR